MPEPHFPNESGDNPSMNSDDLNISEPVAPGSLPPFSSKSNDLDAAKNKDIKTSSSVPAKRFQGIESIDPSEITSFNFAAGRRPTEGTGVRIGERLVEKGYITPEQLKVALQEKQMTGKLLGKVLVDLEFITEEQLSEVVAEAAGYDVFDPKKTIVDGEALSLLGKDEALKLRCLPVSFIDNVIQVAMADPNDVVLMDKLRRMMPRGVSIRPLVIAETMLAEAIDAAYGYSSDVESILAEMEKNTTDDMTKLPEDEAYTHPVVRLVNTLVAEAVKLGVSDLHWEPEENFVRLRYRLDGVLYTAQIIHKKHWSAMSQRIKIISSMNIADKLSPQDGRFELKIGPKSADFRVNSLPTVFGENIVMRVLDKSASIMPLERLGFSPGNLEKIQRAQTRPEGIIIVTGPTGSGKSTSLYSMINAINSVEVDIQTLEDPVEYSLPMIRQTAVREGVLGFGDGIRALLRQDPDIIFIGEIRDGVTAEMALKAAMTGHQVYTTLHTNDSFSAIPRLLDLGLKPGMIAGSIIAVFAQRLARRICMECRVPHVATEDECKLLGVDPSSPPSIYQAKEGGCPACRGKGYKGRIALAEILLFDEELDAVLASGANKAELKKTALKNGFKSMKDDAILKILEGITTIESARTCVDFTR